MRESQRGWRWCGGIQRWIPRPQQHLLLLHQQPTPVAAAEPSQSGIDFSGPGDKTLPWRPHFGGDENDEALGETKGKSHLVDLRPPLRRSPRCSVKKTNKARGHVTWWLIFTAWNYVHSWPSQRWWTRRRATSSSRARGSATWLGCHTPVMNASNASHVGSGQ